MAFLGEVIGENLPVFVKAPTTAGRRQGASVGICTARVSGTNGDQADGVFHIRSSGEPNEPSPSDGT
jgi:hypothetical protein